MVKINFKIMGYFNVLFVSLLIVIGACKKGIFPPDELTISQTPYINGNLRIDGYYYYDFADNTHRAIHFFYNNGVFFKGGAFPLNELLKWEEYYKTEEYHNFARQNMMGWGLFRIENNDINFEYWNPSGRVPVPAYHHNGEILNDTTFVIKTSFRVDGSEIGDVNRIYHFKQFSPKPDSTNNFIK